VHDHSLALKTDGTVWAWGDNHWGQLGDGTNTDRQMPVQTKNLSGVMAIASGYQHSMGVEQ
jgi:alpha-tubulin suppressor-like RCC1 family protein